MACRIPFFRSSFRNEASFGTTMKTQILAILLGLVLHGPASAGFAEGVAAYGKHDYALALKEIAPLARAGDAAAAYLMGAMYYTGRGLAQDQEQAVAWFRKAAEQGHPDAQYALGLMYRYHVGGVPEDAVIAYMLWNLAAASGHRHAGEQRAGVARRMTGKQIVEAQCLSRSWRPGRPLPTRSHLNPFLQ
jgi:TPR repeat protein